MIKRRYIGVCPGKISTGGVQLKLMKMESTQNGEPACQPALKDLPKLPHLHLHPLSQQPFLHRLLLKDFQPPAKSLERWHLNNFTISSIEAQIWRWTSMRGKWSSVSKKNWTVKSGAWRMDSLWTRSFSIKLWILLLGLAVYWHWLTKLNKKENGVTRIKYFYIHSLVLI